MEKDLNQKIQERAYEIWQREGCSGDPEDHWYRAEREVRDTTPAPGDTASGAKAADNQIIDKLGNFA